MRQAELVKVETNPDGSVAVEFSDGSGMVMPDRSALKWFAMSVEDDPDVAKKLLFAWWMARNPAMDNISVVTGKKLTLDLTSPSPIKVQ